MLTLKTQNRVLSAVTLVAGGGFTPDQRCAMQVVAILAGEARMTSTEVAWKCKSTHPSVSQWIVYMNDRLNDRDRQKLKPYLPHLANCDERINTGMWCVVCTEYNDRPLSSAMMWRQTEKYLKILLPDFDVTPTETPSIDADPQMTEFLTNVEHGRIPVLTKMKMLALHALSMF